MIADTPTTPYFAVIFTSVRTNDTALSANSKQENSYEKAAERMFELAAQQPGYLGVESAEGMTISYWKSMEAIKKWKENAEHSEARKKGRTDWYAKFKVRIAKVERDYGFEKPNEQEKKA